jgi:hypothetical protein
LREHFGERVSFVSEREEGYLYAFTTNRAFLAGFVPGYRQVLVGTDTARVRAAFFDFEGNLLEVIECPMPAGVSHVHWVSQAWKALAQEFTAEHQLTEGTIRVKRFRFDEACGIRDFACSWEEAANDPSGVEVEAVNVWIGRWLGDRKFAWDWWRGVGGDWWLDRLTGEVTDT